MTAQVIRVDFRPPQQPRFELRISLGFWFFLPIWTCEIVRTA